MSSKSLEALRKASEDVHPRKPYIQARVLWVCPQCEVQVNLNQGRFDQQREEHINSSWCRHRQLSNRSTRERWVMVHGRYAQWFTDYSLPYLSTLKDGTDRQVYKVPQWIWAVTMVAQKQVPVRQRKRLLQRINEDPHARSVLEVRLRMLLREYDVTAAEYKRSLIVPVARLVGYVANLVDVYYPVAKIVEHYNG